MLTRRNIIVIAGLGVAAAGVLALCLATFAPAASAFDVEGHRGTRGHAPENTLAAFKRALAIGVTTLETDLGVTRDGILVISHNPSLNPDIVRTPDGRWLTAGGPPIHALTLAELERYDIGRIDPATSYARQFPEQEPADGERFPTLAQLFDLVKSLRSPARLNIETSSAIVVPRVDEFGEVSEVAVFVRRSRNPFEPRHLDEAIAWTAAQERPTAATAETWGAA